jgi:cytochrome c-type biogenesis protein CcmH
MIAWGVFLLLGSIFIALGLGRVALKSFSGGALFLLVLGLSLIIYESIGDLKGVHNHQALNRMQASLLKISQRPDVTLEGTLKELQALESKLPDDAIIWNRMGEIYQTISQFRLAKLSFEKAMKLEPSKSEFQMHYLYASSLENQGLLELPLKKMVFKLIRSESKPAALYNLLATDAFMRKEYVTAVEWWAKMLPEIPPEAFRERKTLYAAMKHAAQQSKSSLVHKKIPFHIPIHLALTPDVKRSLSVNASVFVFAKDEKEGPPKYVAKLRSTDLPLDLVLDESHKMMQSENPSDKLLWVGARISESGQVKRGVGDIVASMVSWDPKEPSNVSLLINSNIEQGA